MLRALGLKESSVILMVLSEAFIFSIPAICLSMIIAYLLNIVISLLIFHKAFIAPSYILNPIGIIYVHTMLL